MAKPAPGNRSRSGRGNGSASKPNIPRRLGRRHWYQQPELLVKLPALDFIDDKEGKPVGIQSRIGQRPIAAFGNSDGDLQMLQWLITGGGSRFALFVHHDDGVANTPTWWGCRPIAPTSCSSSINGGMRPSPMLARHQYETGLENHLPPQH
jgi:hypothetical protein